MKEAVKILQWLNNLRGPALLRCYQYRYLHGGLRHEMNDKPMDGRTTFCGNSHGVTWTRCTTMNHHLLYQMN